MKNGAARILDALMAQGWLTHLATNGAGTIHDWEYAWLGRSTESVRDGVARGCFGTWDETGRNIHVALLAAGVAGEGYGRALGRFIAEDGATLPRARGPGRRHPPRTGASAHGRAGRVARGHAANTACRRALRDAAPLERGLDPGRRLPPRRADHACIRASATTSSPRIRCSTARRSAARPSAISPSSAGAVEGLDGGVVLSVGSAIMGPQVFEKSLSCVNNLRLQAGRPIVAGHTIYVVDLQDGGGWDWTAGEPPKTNPAYYLRFCKSYSRMGGTMCYLQCDNLAFIHHLFHRLNGHVG